MSDAPFDQPAFDAWLVADPRHGPLFETMWHRIMGPGIDEALGTYARRRRRRRALAGSAVACLLLISGGYLARPMLELRFAAAQDYAAAEGTIRQIRLDDGTRLTLAGGTHVRVRLTRHDRVVDLARGTLFADVAHESRPFRVDAGNATIVDLGTRFEISSKPSAIRVAVEHGAVQLASRTWFGPRVDLSANQAAALTDAGLSGVSRVRPGGVARWRSDWVEYHDAPLWQVMQDLESVSPASISIVDAPLADLRVSGRIRLIDPMRQIANLALLHGFRVDRREDAILLTQRLASPMPGTAALSSSGQ